MRRRAIVGPCEILVHREHFVHYYLVCFIPAFPSPVTSLCPGFVTRLLPKEPALVSTFAPLTDFHTQSTASAALDTPAAFHG